jgi:hypothetical protein
MVVGGLRRCIARVVAVVVMAVVVAGAAPPAVPGFTDISQTALGRSIARQAAARLAALAAGDLVVLRDASGFTVGPRGAGYVALGGVATPVTVGRAISVAGGGPSWSPVAGQCFSRISDTFAWLDHCYVLYRLANDGDPARDWFALHHYATMQANPPWVMNGAAIGSAPVGSTPQAWADWAPRSDLASSGCQQILVGIASPVGGIADSVTQCETWTVAKSPVAGTFAVHWDGRGKRTTRELAMQLSVSVPANGWPQWALPASVSGSPF